MSAERWFRVTSSPKPLCRMPRHGDKAAVPSFKMQRLLFTLTYDQLAKVYMRRAARR